MPVYTIPDNVATFGKTSYTERNTGSPRLSGTQGDMRMVRDLFIWPGTIEARYQAQLDFLGYPTFTTVQAPGLSMLPYPYRYLSRHLPDYAEWTQAPDDSLICTSFSDDIGAGGGVEPSFNDTYDISEYAASQATLEYRTTNYSILPDSQCVSYNDPLTGIFRTGYYLSTFGVDVPDEGLMMRYIERYWRYSGRVTTIPTGVTAFKPDISDSFPNGQFLPNKGGYPYRETLVELTYVWKFVPLAALPTQQIYSQINTINNAIFDLPGWRVPYGCGLFIGAEPKNLGKLVTGEPGCDMEYKFLVAPHVIQIGNNAGKAGGWSRGLTIVPPSAPYNGGVDYRDIVAFWDGVVSAPITFSDFSVLFRPPQGVYTLLQGIG